MRKAPVLTKFIIAASLVYCTSTFAQDVVVIDENLDLLPAGYSLLTGASENATANLQIGDIGGATGLLFNGTWNVPANGQEFAVGALAPDTSTAAAFQYDPSTAGAVTSLRWSLDLETISATMRPGVQGIFAQLVIFQLQADDSVEAYFDGGNFIAAGESLTLDVTAAAADFGQTTPGNNPDFSTSGGPIAFGLQFGAQYPQVAIPSPLFLNGQLNADNWSVTLTTDAITPPSDDVFKDGFEAPAANVTAGKTLTEPAAGCNCSAPSPDLSLTRD